jgi:hypothetical protein
MTRINYDDNFHCHDRELNVSHFIVQRKKKEASNLLLSTEAYNVIKTREIISRFVKRHLRVMLRVSRMTRRLI